MENNMTPRDDERRKFEAHFGPEPDRHGINGLNRHRSWSFKLEGWLARAEQAETPRASQTREELEKKWPAQTEWQDFTNWLIHVKLGYVSVENCPGPSCTVCGAAMQPNVEFKCPSCGSTPACTEPVRASELCSFHSTLVQGCPQCASRPLAAAPVEDRPASTPPYPDHECAGCNLGKELMVGKPSSIVGQGAIHLPEGWVCMKWLDPKAYAAYAHIKLAGAPEKE